MLLFPARCFSRWLSASGKASAYCRPLSSLDRKKKMPASGSLTRPGSLRCSPAQPPHPPGGRGRPGASPEVPVAAAKSWALSAAGFLGAKGEALDAGRETERVPARCASLSCGTCIRDRAQTRAACEVLRRAAGETAGSAFPLRGRRHCAPPSPSAVNRGPGGFQACRLDVGDSKGSKDT